MPASQAQAQRVLLRVAQREPAAPAPALAVTALAEAVAPPERVPCAALLPRAAECNTKKVIPSSDDDMPPLWRAPPPGGARWGPLEPGHKGSGGCCLVSDLYRLIYIRNPKTAGTTVEHFLQQHACPAADDGSAAPSAACAGANFGRLGTRTCPLDAIAPERGTASGGCADIPRWKWLHYYVFSTVRHPLARAVSSYYYCNKTLTRSFAEFCVNPDAGNWCSRSTAVKESADEPEPLPEPPGWAPGDAVDLPDMHWRAQTMQMCGVYGCMCDFFVRTESFSADFDVAVASINALRSPEVQPLPRFSDKPLLRNPTAKRVAAFVDADTVYAAPENAHCRAAVLAWYADDYERLGYANLDVASASSQLR